MVRYSRYIIKWGPGGYLAHSWRRFPPISGIFHANSISPCSKEINGLVALWEFDAEGKVSNQTVGAVWVAFLSLADRTEMHRFQMVIRSIAQLVPSDPLDNNDRLYKRIWFAICRARMVHN